MTDPRNTLKRAAEYLVDKLERLAALAAAKGSGHE